MSTEISTHTAGSRTDSSLAQLMRLSSADVEPRVAAEPVQVAIDWDALAPRHAYARIGRPLLDAAILCAVAVPALAIGSLVLLVNAIVFRSVCKAFFVQPRIGLRGRVFHLVKFRTMREAPHGNFESWSRGDRARVTAFGTFLRNAHLDELPQLINVLRGEMSFIGPRPEMIEVEHWASEHVPGFVERLAIRPGITGLAQITQGYTGRDVDAYREKLAINRDYIERMSLAFDLAIIARTVAWMLRGKGWDWRAQGRSAR
jgi:lipopolysaccharide/colanic/teichoic acid biosynthesis glycosyltransferase